MGNLLSFLLRGFEPQARIQAMTFERARAAASADPVVTPAEVAHALRGTDPVPMYELPDGTPLLIDRGVRRLHQLRVGATGAGKSYDAAGQLLDEIHRALTALLRHPEQEGEQLPLALHVVDVKSETVRLLKLGIAALFVAASPRARRAITRSIHAIEWRRDAITPLPLLSPLSDISPEYEAELKIDILVRTSRQEWPESVRFVFFQMLRICKAMGEQPHPKFIAQLLHDADARNAVIPHLAAPDLRDFLEKVDKLLRPQTIEAVERRIAIEFAYPPVYLSTFLPHEEIVRRNVPTDARIVLADCGSTDLPPSIGMARANLLATDAFLSATRRDPAVRLTIFLEEALLLLANAPGLLSRVLDALRVLRSTNTAVMFATQAVDALPKSAVRELITNTGALTAFQSRADVAEILAPHVTGASGRVARRESFARDLTSLKPRDAYLWVKSAGGAIRVRSRELPDAGRAAGMPADELLDLFDREITPTSRVGTDAARAAIERWEAARFSGPARGNAARTPRRGTAPPETSPSLRSMLGLDGENDD